MAKVPFVLVIDTVRMLAQVGSTEKIVELCNEWLDVFGAVEQKMHPTAFGEEGNEYLAEYNQIREQAGLSKLGGG